MAVIELLISSRLKRQRSTVGRYAGQYLTEALLYVLVDGMELACHDFT